MFDYTANAEDEIDLKQGDIVTIINKVWRLIKIELITLLSWPVWC